MLLKQETLREIKNGSITLAFRKWRRPTVKASGTLLTSIGQVAIAAVEVVSLEEIKESEALAAGFSNLESLRSQLMQRAAIPDDAELQKILQRLQRLDSRNASGPWTHRVLEQLRERPGVCAMDLARDFGMERAKFKANVRKLKGLGLTESLEVGYRLSPRGEAVLQRLEDLRDGLG
jgi:hypothetical protein